MGSGIALLVAQHGYPVCVVTRRSAPDVRAGMLSDLQRARERGLVSTEAADATAQLVHVTSGMEALRSCQIVVECTQEDLSTKRSVLLDAEVHTPSDAVLATNTSSLGIDELGAPLRRRERFLGTHFFNPVHKLPLVELVSGSCTSLEALDRAERLLCSIERTVIRVTDCPGLVVNRLLLPALDAAASLWGTGACAADGIDLAMRLGAGHPMGPLTLGDYIGWDVVEAALDQMARRTANPALGASSIVRELVRLGRTGRKSGCGVYRYSAPGGSISGPAPAPTPGRGDLT
jgi:3-hydroxybutyryl-CoA dehydrogenase